MQEALKKAFDKSFFLKRRSVLKRLYELSNGEQLDCLMGKGGAFLSSGQNALAFCYLYRAYVVCVEGSLELPSSLPGHLVELYHRLGFCYTAEALIVRFDLDVDVSAWSYPKGDLYRELELICVEFYQSISHSYFSDEVLGFSDVDYFNLAFVKLLGLLDKVYGNYVKPLLVEGGRKPELYLPRCHSLDEVLEVVGGMPFSDPDAAADAHFSSPYLATQSSSHHCGIIAYLWGIASQIKHIGFVYDCVTLCRDFILRLERAVVRSQALCRVNTWTRRVFGWGGAEARTSSPVSVVNVAVRLSDDDEERRFNALARKAQRLLKKHLPREEGNCRVVSSVVPVASPASFQRYSRLGGGARRVVCVGVLDKVDANQVGGNESSSDLIIDSF